MKIWITLPLLFATLLSFCSGSNGQSSNSPVANSAGVNNENKLEFIPANISLIDNSFLFFVQDKKGFLLFPDINVKAISSHFPISLLAADIIQCAVITSSSSKKQAIVKATVIKDFKGDISKIQDFCAGEGSTITVTINKQVFTIPKADIDTIYKHKRMKSNRFIIPTIPYYFPSINDLITTEIDQTMAMINISFLNRLTQKVVTNCNYYIVDGKKDVLCYGAPTITPLKSFYGKTWKSRHLRTLSSIVLYKNANNIDSL